MQQLPVVGELVVARLESRNEPFGIGRVVATNGGSGVAHTFKRASSSASAASHSVQAGKCGPPAAAAAAAAAAPAAASSVAATVELESEDLPLSALKAQPQSQVSSVSVRWYDLEESCVTRLKLNDDAHWQALYTTHAAADAAMTARLGHKPPSMAWIVDKFQTAAFFPKPSSGEPCDTLPMESLIMWGSRELILFSTGQLTETAFEAIRADLTEEVHRHSAPLKKKKSPLRKLGILGDEDAILGDDASMAVHVGAMAKMPRRPREPLHSRKSAGSASSPAAAAGGSGQLGSERKRKAERAAVASDDETDAAAAPTPAASKKTKGTPAAVTPPPPFDGALRATGPDQRLLAAAGAGRVGRAEHSSEEEVNFLSGRYRGLFGRHPIDPMHHMQLSAYGPYGVPCSSCAYLRQMIDLQSSEIGTLERKIRLLSSPAARAALFQTPMPLSPY
jgi:hypothetical protein